MRDRLHRSETGSKIPLFQSHRFLIRIPQLTSNEDEEEEGWRQPALPLLRDASDSYPKLSCDPPRFPDKACKPPHQPTSLTSHPNVAQAGPSRLRDSPPSIIPTGYQWYIHHLDSHILFSYNNTLGRSPLDRFKRLDPSPIPPTSITWTTEEKRLFFRSLSRYSRLRPDRIAGDIRTKSQAEVEWYLALLQGAVESRRRTDGARRGFTNRSTRGFANRSTRGDRHQSRREGRAEGACEVSEDWVVKEEEELALAVEKNVQRREKVREDDVRAKRRKELRGAMSMSRQEGCASWDDPAIEEAERVDALEDWGKSLNSTKLGALDKLLMPERAEWYAKRLKTRKEPFPSPSPSDAPANTSRSITTDHSIDKNGEIAKETRRLKELTAIPKQDRTHEQKAEYSKSLNRKRARENYRTAKLLAEGMTEDEILRLGGADAVFASRGGGKPGCVLESGDEVKRLKRMGMDTYIKQKRWEVFNFDRMAQLIQKSDGLGEDLSLSFTILQDLHVELLAYLKPLIYQIITLAENSLIQTLDDPPEIIANHVHQAQASRGERFEASANSLTRQSVEDATETPSLGHLDDEAKVSAIKRSRLETYVDPPGDVSWWQMPLAQPDDQDEVEEESDEDDLSSTLTDQEDFELDEAMDAMDRAYDEVHEGRLWRAAEGDLEEGEGGEDDEGAGEARAALLRAQSEIIRARRHRHAMRNRAFTAMTPNSGIRVKKERARRFRLSDTVDSDFEGSSQDHESGMDGVLEEGEEEISEETSDL